MLRSNHLRSIIPLILVAALVVPVDVEAISCFADGSISVSADYDSVYVTVHLFRQYCGSCDTLPDTYYEQWSPNEECDPKPTTRSYMGRNYPFAHFRILSPDGQCLLLDSRLDGTLGSGMMAGSFAFPIGEILSEGDFIFTNSGDYDEVVLDGYWQHTNFGLDRDAVYRFQLVSMVQTCTGLADPEIVIGTETLFLSCCHVRVGDANCSGDDEPTISDISLIIDHVLGPNYPALCCRAEADVNQSGGQNPPDGEITVSDATVLIDYLFITGPSLGLADCLY